MADGESTEDILEQQKKNCVFCHIISGKVKSRKVYEDDELIGVLDINPAAPGHVLLLPKRHVVILPQLTDPEIGHIAVVAKTVSKTLLKAFKAQGTNIFVANGAVAGQRAPHFMVHIIPRRENDGLSLVPPQNTISESDIMQIKARLMPKIQESFKLTDAQVQSLMAAAPQKTIVPPSQAPMAPEEEPTVPPGKIRSKVDFGAIENYFKKDGMQNLRAPKRAKK